MTKKELADKIAEATGVSKKDSETVINEAIAQIVSAVAAGDKVAFVGFGTFEARERAAREGKNLRTGESIKIAACKVPAFKAGKAFKEAINKK